MVRILESGDGTRVWIELTSAGVASRFPGSFATHRQLNMPLTGGERFTSLPERFFRSVSSATSDTGKTGRDLE